MLIHAHTRRALAGALIVLAGCVRHAPPATTATTAAAPAQVADRLVFGRSIPGGGIVTEADWDRFVREVVTPRFPDGLSVWRGEGQWRDATGAVVREPVVVLELFHGGDARTDESLRAVAEAYKKRFRQEAVMRVTSAASVRLLDD